MPTAALDANVTAPEASVRVLSTLFKCGHFSSPLERLAATRIQLPDATLKLGDGLARHPENRHLALCERAAHESLALSPTPMLDLSARERGLHAHSS